MGTIESKDSIGERITGRRRPQATVSARSPYQPPQAEAEENEIGRESSLIYASILLELFDNASNWQHLPYPRRITLMESIRQTRTNESASDRELHQNLTEIVMEGLLTCDSLSAEEKNLIVMDGLLEQRWDRVFARYIPRKWYEIQEKTLDEFYSYRHMILVLFKNSAKMQQQLSEDSRQRVKQLILQTHSQEKLDGLLRQILERTCEVEFQKKIMTDMAACRYYRLVWPDRLDCQESTHVVATGVVIETEADNDRKLPATTTTKTVACGSILLPDDLSHRQDCCPICLDPVLAPALELSCHHVFCSRCISNWILQQQSSHNPHSGGTDSLDNSKSPGWYCPVCRQVHVNR